MKTLILIDQTPLLQSAIRDLEDWHQQIENLEIEIQRFQDHDLKLFGDWSELAIQKHRHEIDGLTRAYEKLTTFHNWVVFTSENLNISLPHAFHLMKKEEELFQNGTPEQKEKITVLRKERDEEIEFQLNGFSSEPNADEEADEEAPTREEKINAARDLHEYTIKYYEALSEKKIKKIMQDYEEGLYLLAECVGVCLETYRYDLILKVWNVTPIKIKKAFNHGFKNEFGLSLDAFLKRATDQARDEAGVDFDEDFDSATHFENPSRRKKTAPAENPEKAELAKIFYRRLMLKVHPDKLPADFVTTKKTWLDRLWKKIQTAYNEGNAGALEQLHLQVLITLKKYDEVSFSELKQGADLLKKEFKRIHESQRQTREHPAWGFSELKSYKKLEREITEPYEQNKKHILKEMGRP